MAEGGDVATNGGRREQRIGLALSGGTLKAAAHIGVIEALMHLGIRPDAVAGTSAGALIASLYAHGHTPASMRRLSRKFSLFQLFDYGFPIVSSLVQLLRYRMGISLAGGQLPAAQGLLAGGKLERFIARALARRTAILPFYIIATDLYSGRPITFSNDPVAIRSGQAVRCGHVPRTIAASCALPAIFSPVSIGPHLLVDGAFRHYVPVQVLQDAGCEKIIAVNLYQLDDQWRPETLVHVLVRSFEIMLQETIDNDTASADVVLIEPDTRNMSWIAVHQLSRCIEAGRTATYGKKEEIWHLLQS